MWPVSSPFKRYTVIRHQIRIAAGARHVARASHLLTSNGHFLLGASPLRLSNYPFPMHEVHAWVRRNRTSSFHTTGPATLLLAENVGSHEAFRTFTPICLLCGNEIFLKCYRNPGEDRRRTRDYGKRSLTLQQEDMLSDVDSLIGMSSKIF